MRDKGDGSVYQRSDGRWVGQIEDGYTKTGSRAYRRRIRDTETEARRAVRDMLRDMAGDGGDLDPRTTVKRWADDWLKDQAGHVRPDVLSGRDGHIRNWIVPQIGNRRLSALTAADARKLERAILAADRSATTAHNVRVTLQTMLKAAVVEGHTIPRPVLAARMTAAAESERDAIPLADAVRILDGTSAPTSSPAATATSATGSSRRSATGACPRSPQPTRASLSAPSSPPTDPRPPRTTSASPSRRCSRPPSSRATRSPAPCSQPA